MLGRDSTPLLREGGLENLRSTFGLFPRAKILLPSLVYFNAPDNFGEPVQSTVLPRERGLKSLRSNYDLLSRAVISRLLLVLPMRQTASDTSIHAVLLPCTHQWRGTHGWTILLPRAVRMTSGKCFRIQRNAWPDSGYMFCISLRKFWKIFAPFLREGGFLS